MSTNQVQHTIHPYLLRRTKALVLADLPQKRQVTIYTSLTPMQQAWYKGVLTKNISAMGGGKKRLVNLMMQLRKVCDTEGHYIWMNLFILFVGLID
jgi:SNF2 family DNA or RNA helicase